MPEWVFQVLAVAGSAAAVYAGIRADLAAMRAKVESASHAANHAHRRIDDLLMMGSGK